MFSSIKFRAPIKRKRDQFQLYYQKLAFCNNMVEIIFKQVSRPYTTKRQIQTPLSCRPADSNIFNKRERNDMMWIMKVTGTPWSKITYDK